MVWWAKCFEKKSIHGLTCQQAYLVQTHNVTHDPKTGNHLLKLVLEDLALMERLYGVQVIHGALMMGPMERRCNGYSRCNFHGSLCCYAGCIKSTLLLVMCLEFVGVWLRTSIMHLRWWNGLTTTVLHLSSFIKRKCLPSWELPGPSFFSLLLDGLPITSLSPISWNSSNLFNFVGLAMRND